MSGKVIVKKLCQRMGILMAVLVFGVLVAASFQKVLAQSGSHFSLIILPDTQMYVNTKSDNTNNSAILESQIAWILANQQLKNIAFVMQEGDMTNANIQPEWDRFATAIKKMDGKIPYALATGNHDRLLIGQTGIDSAYVNFNKNFPILNYKQYGYFGGSFKPDKLENAYYLFSAGGRDWVVLSLAFAPSDGVLKWANEIADQYVNRQVIVLTHSYMYCDSHPNYPNSLIENTRVGQIAGQYYEAGCPECGNTGEAIWNKFVKLHKNITLVFSGHILGSGIGRRVDTGTYGNQVFQMLANYQMYANATDKSQRGALRIVDIYPDGKAFNVKTYSPFNGSFSTDSSNQFGYTGVNSFAVNTPTPTKIPTSTPKPPTSTPKPPTSTPVISLCTQCPSDFKCYSNGSEYKWFVTGYVMQGFTTSSSTTCGGVIKPSYLGKSKGDANCDGKNDVLDFSLWHKEFFDGNKGAIVNKTWNTDFTGTNGVCDGKVDVFDYSLWQKFFNELK